MANKRSKATEVEQFYIESNPKGLTQQELANKFEMSVKTVAGIQQRYREKVAQEVVENTPPAKEPSMTRQMMVSKTQSGKKGVVIMTKGASERCDDSIKHARNILKKNKYNNDYTAKSYPSDE